MDSNKENRCEVSSIVEWQVDLLFDLFAVMSAT